jgi:iron(III) transport system substrate-binding protein
MRRILFAACILTLATPAFAADAALIAAARKEGAVTWYTNQILDQFARPVAAAFEKKYGVKVAPVRANNAEITLRVMNEATAGHIAADVVDGTAAGTALKKKDLILKWLPDRAGAYPAQYVDPNGYWISPNIYVLTPGFNTNLVPKGAEPKTWDDLLDPKWKGRMAWSAPPASYLVPEFIGMVIQEYGEEKGRAYLRKLAKQNIAALGVSARTVLDQVIAGEYAIGLQIFNHQAPISAAKGAPVAWIPMKPKVLTVLSVMSVVNGAPHPNAGKLLVDYLISEEGQKLWRDAGYIPTDPNVKTKDPKLRPDGGAVDAVYMTPEEIDEKIAAWSKIYDEIFR